ncbi:hypothetical protein WA158_007455 [Blastocystis sp. Blastoise]
MEQLTSLQQTKKKKDDDIITEETNNKPDINPKSKYYSEVKEGVKRYNANPVVYGFKKLTKNSYFCLICESTLTCKGYEASKLFTHFKNKHGLSKYTYDDIQELLKDHNENTEYSNSLFSFSDLSSKLSYFIAYSISKNGYSYRTGEKLVKPIIEEYERLKNVKVLSNLPLSSSSIKRKSDEIALTIQQEVINRIRQSGSFSIQLDESTDIEMKSYLLVYARYEYNKKFTESFLSIFQISSKTGDNIFNMVDNFFNNNNLLWNNCVSATFDGASNMNGDKNSFKTRVLEKNKNCMFIHCFLHREELCVNCLPKYFTNIFKSAVEIISYIKKSAVRQDESNNYNIDNEYSLTSSIFSPQDNIPDSPNNISSLEIEYNKVVESLLDTSDTDNNIDNNIHEVYSNDKKEEKKEKNIRSYKLLLYCPTRWLSCHSSIKRFNLLRNGITLVIKKDKEKKDLYNTIIDTNFIASMLYLEDVTSLFYDCNKSMQGQHRYIFGLIDIMKDLFIKLSLRLERLINNNDYSSFTKLKDYVSTTKLDINSIIFYIKNHLITLRRNLLNYFPEILNYIGSDESYLQDLNEYLIDQENTHNTSNISHEVNSNVNNNTSVVSNQFNILGSLQGCVSPNGVVNGLITYVDIVTQQLIETQVTIRIDFPYLVYGYTLGSISGVLNNFPNSSIQGQYNGIISNINIIQANINCIITLGAIIPNEISNNTNQGEVQKNKKQKKTNSNIKKPKNTPTTNLIDHSLYWITNPFSKVADENKMEFHVKEEYFCLLADKTCREEFNNVPIDEFYISHKSRFPLLYDIAKKCFLPFATSYLCESGFSHLVYIKNKYRNTINPTTQMTIGLTSDIIDSSSLITTVLERMYIINKLKKKKLD